MPKRCCTASAWLGGAGATRPPWPAPHDGRGCFGVPKVKASGIDLHYITVGAGPDIVMLHGFLGNLAVWHLYMAPILRRDHRVTTYDLRDRKSTRLNSS